MKETRFIEQNKEKWNEFEQLLKSKSKNPDKISKLYVEITEDLSFAKTYYPNRLVKQYLNGLSQKLYLSLYKNRKKPFERLKFFFTEEIPFVMYESRWQVFISFFAFSLATIIGIVSCLNDPEYAAVVTSKFYVEMTKQNIASGDPMAVYKDPDAFNMFLRIGWNNLRVSFYAFTLGITAGLGTIFFMLINGTMLGGFQFFFLGKGVFWQSVLTIWQHGTIEILCIILAGGAGIIMGSGLIFPNTYPRIQSLQISAKKGLKLMIALVPLIILAAFIEAYITRLTEAPVVFRLFVIAASLIIMVGYFVVYPYLKSRSGFHASLQFERPPTQKEFVVDIKKIMSPGEVFSGSFNVYSGKVGLVILASTIIAAVYGLVHSVYYEAQIFVWDFEDFGDILLEYLKYTFFSFLSFFDFSNNKLFLPINIVAFTTLLLLSVKIIASKIEIGKVNYLRILFLGLIFSGIINLAFLADNGFLYFIVFLLLPIILLAFSVATFAKHSFFSSIAKAFKMTFSRIMDTFLLWVILSVVLVVFMLISNSTIASFLIDFVSTNFLMDSATIEKFYAFTSAFTAVFTFAMVLPIVLISVYLFFFSLREINDAENLLHKIENFDAL